MTFLRAAMAATLVALATLGQTTLQAQSPTDLSGSWALNRQSSQFPQDIGFSASFIPTEQPTGPDRGGRRRGVQSESQEEASRLRFLTDEVRVPPERLAIEVTPALVTITPDPGAPRTIQPGRRDQEVKIGPVTAITNSAWDGARLTIAYEAGASRLIRYTYSLNQSPVALIVDVEFIEGRAISDKVRRVYEKAPALPPPSTSSSAAPPREAAPPPTTQLPPTTPSSPSIPTAAIDQRPDAPLKGLTRLGVVVEGVGAEAA